MAKILRLPDLLLAGLLTGFAAAAFLASRLSAWLFRRRPKSAPRIQLTLTSGSHAANAKRNIDKIYEACLLNGFFEKCLFVYYLADQPRAFDFSPRIYVEDFRAAFPDRLKRAGFSFTANLLQQILFVRRLTQIIDHFGVTHIQANDPYIQGLSAYLASRLTGVPYVVRAVCDYDHYYEKFGRLAFSVLRRRSIEKWIEHFVWAHADGVTSWNENYLRYVLKNHGPADRSVIVGNFTDPLYFEPSVAGEKPKPPFALREKKILVYLGRLSWDKYCLDLVEALAEIVRQEPAALLVVLGDGEQRGEFEKRARERGVFEHIYLPGFQTVEQIIGWTREAKVMLATHAGFSLIELGALGIPVVAYQYEWHPEVVRNGVSGTLVEFRNPQEMAKAAVAILKDAQLQKTLADGLRRIIRADQEPAVLTARFAEFFRLVSERQKNTQLHLAKAYENFCREKRGQA